MDKPRSEIGSQTSANTDFSIHVASVFHLRLLPRFRVFRGFPSIAQLRPSDFLAVPFVPKSSQTPPSNSQTIPNPLFNALTDKHRPIFRELSLPWHFQKASTDFGRASSRSPRPRFVTFASLLKLHAAYRIGAQVSHERDSWVIPDFVLPDPESILVAFWVHPGSKNS
jgi:hypothetical protein